MTRAASLCRACVLLFVAFAFVAAVGAQTTATTTAKPAPTPAPTKPPAKPAPTTTTATATKPAATSKPTAKPVPAVAKVAPAKIAPAKPKPRAKVNVPSVIINIRAVNTTYRNATDPECPFNLAQNLNKRMERIKVDLNSGTQSHRIYLCVERMFNPRTFGQVPIKTIHFHVSNVRSLKYTCPPETEKMQYVPIGNTGRDALDLNWGTGGAKVFGCAVKLKGTTGGGVLSDIQINTFPRHTPPHKTLCTPPWSNPGPDTNKLIDLNEKAGGDWVRMCLKFAADDTGLTV